VKLDGETDGERVGENPVGEKGGLENGGHGLEMDGGDTSERSMLEKEGTGHSRSRDGRR